MVKLIVASFLLFPVAEIAVFALVAALIGLIWALALLIATTALGVLVLRWAGRGALSGFRVAMSDKNVTAIEADSSGFLLIVGGILLVIPGFITDFLGLLLLLGPIRRWCGTILGRSLRGRVRPANPVVDLKPDQWRQLPERELQEPPRSRPADLVPPKAP